MCEEVEAVKNADPVKSAEALHIHLLNYTEVIEMAYYGSQFIHPKTIKPLQNKNIPLYVKSFIDPALPGTVINGSKAIQLPPVIVLKEGQTLIHFGSRDFSFIEGAAKEKLYEIFKKIKLQPNLSQNTAISLICCFEGHTEKTGEIAAEASLLFDVEVERDLSLLTIRHYDEATVKKFTQEKNIILEQRTPETLQAVIRAIG